MRNTLHESSNSVSTCENMKKTGLLFVKKRALSSSSSSSSSSSGEDNDDEPTRKQVKTGLHTQQAPRMGGVADQFLKQASSTSNVPIYNKFAEEMLVKMGHEAGKGLGRFGQGRVNIVEASTQHGRRGLGMTVRGFEASSVEWDFDKEKVTVEETVTWIDRCEDAAPSLDEMLTWIKEGKKKLTIDDETEFCAETTLNDVIACKSIFDNLEGEEMRRARTKSNPFETIRGVFFLNRAAMKMANMDAVFDFMFTNPKDSQQRPLVSPSELLYFADICAGPGGFSEYVLWRKKKGDAKGFGFTLKGSCDFVLENFYAAPSEMFEPYYGVGGLEGDGDIYRPDNLKSFQQFVFENTNDKGVHFVMADGGFSVDGQENIQEILSKRLYLCQFLCALMILRKDGHFVCKLFDVFTPFSAGLVYLMYRAFQQVCIFKPVTSRPANSERYIVCKGMRSDSESIQQYMFEMNLKFHGFCVTSDRDIVQAVPLEILQGDKKFYEYLVKSNDQLGYQQAIALSKIQAFSRNKDLHEHRQATIRGQCLQLWKIPEQLRTAPNRSEPTHVRFNNLIKTATDFEHTTRLLTAETLQDIKSVLDYRCMLVGSADSCLLLSLGKSFVFKWDGQAATPWTRLEELQTELPRDTIVEAEVVQEMRGQGRGQRRLRALHIIDAMFLCGEDIRALAFSERAINYTLKVPDLLNLCYHRMERLKKFVKAISRPTRFNLAPVRVKDVFRLQDIEQVFEKLSLQTVRGQPLPCYCIQQLEGQQPNYYQPGGVRFIKVIKDPWMMGWSKSQARQYFYHTLKHESRFERPDNCNSSFLDSWRQRLFWKWEEGVQLVEGQRRRDEDKVSRDTIKGFLAEKCTWLHK